MSKEFDLEEPEGFVLDGDAVLTAIPILTHNFYILGFIALEFASQNPYIRIIESPDLASTMDDNKKKIVEAALGSLWEEHKFFGVVNCVFPEKQEKMAIKDDSDMMTMEEIEDFMGKDRIEAFQKLRVRGGSNA